MNKKQKLAGLGAIASASLVMAASSPRTAAQNKPDNQKTLRELVLEARQRQSNPSQTQTTTTPSGSTTSTGNTTQSGGTATAPADHPGYDDTPFLPGDKWRVHDKRRPEPPVVTSGTFSTQDTPGQPPSDAIVLFNGTDLSKWQVGNGQTPGWIVQNGYMQVPPKGTAGGGSIQTRDKFGDVQLHIEWSTPNPPRGESQGRGNSGVLLMGRYEIQVLDSYQAQTYVDGQAGAIYGQYPPLVNASRPPGQWQIYDIIFKAPRFKDNKLETPAHVTVIHNGVVLHHATPIIGGASHRNLATYSPHEPTAPLQLQDHNDPVRYRNIWIRPLKNYDEQ